MLRKTNHIPAMLSPGERPVLLVVVDTEEEFDWDAPFDRANVGTSAIAGVPLMHERVFDKFGIVPTYMCDWPIVTTPAAAQVMRGLLDAGRCDIGTHLHPWVSPPHSEEVTYRNSYAGNLPPELEYEKLCMLTQASADAFGKAPVIFKAGRYGLGLQTAESIARLGYEIDASIVPYTSFRYDGGPDFRTYREHPYWFTAGGRELLEVPVTTGFTGRLRELGPRWFELTQHPWVKKTHVGGVLARTGMLERIRLSPEVSTGDEMRRLTAALFNEGCAVFTLTYHSPSMAPGHTPYVRTAADLERFIAAVHDYCAWFRDEFGGQCLSMDQFKHKVRAARGGGGAEASSQARDRLASA